jgi:hypothetical protein
MKRAWNDESAGLLAQQHATFDSENAAAEARILTRPKSSWERRAEEAESKLAALIHAIEALRGEMEQIRAMCVEAGMDERSTTLDYLRSAFYLLPKRTR